MAYIETIEHSNAKGELKEIYDSLVKSRGKIADVHKIQSLNPESIVKHMELYMTVMFGKSPVSRSKREMMAVIVSTSNNCPYCIRHHAEALQHYWKDTDKLNSLIETGTHSDLSEEEIALCEYARELTMNPGDMKQSHVERLKKLGLSDRAILDATLVISYFNFVNRNVQALGVELEDDPGGYNY
jgi:uncharacterized peroxidase-related enzyme